MKNINSSKNSGDSYARTALLFDRKWEVLSILAKEL